VSKALEEARKSREIGLSLDAQVRLTLPEKMMDFIRPYEKDLKSIFIVSSVTLQETKDAKEIKTEVLSAAGKKCERCWNYDLSVGHHSEHPTLCGRCAEAINA
jgi:isoleucyl-tRNA synthetase